MSEKFTALADEFDQRIDTYVFTQTTNVRLIYVCVDQGGNEVRHEVDSLATATVGGYGDAGPAAAMKMYKDLLHQNINSLVRGASDGWVRLRDVPQFPLQTINFELVIEG